ncbi:MAG: hypothetical protein PUC50_11910 [Bacteroidales bacterium]|nr:hypothetical protein [Bacteroidales bacterium]
MDEHIKLETQPNNSNFWKGLLFFIPTGVLCTIAGYINGTYVMSNNEYYLLMYPQLNEEQVASLNQTPIWLNCIAPIITNLFFVFVVSLVVFIGYYLTTKVKFGTIFKCTALSQTVFAIMYIAYYTLIGLYKFPDCLAELSIMPLSLASFFDVCRLDMWMIPPLSYVNVFEIAYMALLAYLLSKNVKQQYKESLKMVLYTYGLMLLLIVVCVSAGSVYMTE